MDRVSSIEEIRAWPPTVPIVKGGAALGYGANGTYAAYKSGDFPLQVLKIGRRLRIVTAELVRLLEAGGS
ncbi:hypothetical protein [Jatrophihabitans endophyticus]|uniref:hypothetical protein n=1 Tax=Jatrophihabitans endophyticus TaxID=1206085 RepID=UPI00190EF5A6|nr:hypothetical protein [Jatrophihabitans endophyticus]